MKGVPWSPSAEKLGQFGFLAGWYGDVQFDVLVTVADSATSQTQLGAITGIRRDGQFYIALDGWDRNGRSERRLFQRDRQSDDDIVTGTAEKRMRRDRDVDQRVARWATARPGTALALESNDMAILDAGWNFHIECAAVGQQHAARGAVRRV